MPLSRFLRFTLPLAVVLSVTSGCFSKSKPNKYPDGRVRLPLLGNRSTFFALQAGPDKELLKLARKFGSHCKLWFGLNPVMIVSSPKSSEGVVGQG